MARSINPEFCAWEMVLALRPGQKISIKDVLANGWSPAATNQIKSALEMDVQQGYLQKSGSGYIRTEKQERPLKYAKEESSSGFEEIDSFND